MKEKLSFEELQSIGVDKDVLKKIEPKFPQKEIDLDFETLRTVLDEGINSRLLIELLVAEPDRDAYIDDLNIAYREWVQKDIALQSEFSSYPITMKEGEEHVLRMKKAWEAFANTGYNTESRPWNAYKNALSESIETFDRNTQLPGAIYAIRTVLTRGQRIDIEASIVADAAVGS